MEIKDFQSVHEVEAIVKKAEQYLYKLIMAEAEKAGSLSALGSKIGYDGIEKDVKKSKVYDLIRIAKQL